ncbi:MAG: aminotransferase class I/II-fold pyridoxal phosphate-dependent enzyme, partial [Gammaproteobacteria bacterium]
MSVYKDVEQALQQLREKDLYRSRHPLQSAQGPEIRIAGRQLINFSSNDYLGLANDARIKNWLIDALQVLGVGAGASQLIVGYNETHRELELALSGWLQRDATLLFPSGYMANLAIASTLIDKNSVVIQDKLNHASLIDAATLSPGKLARYPHSDMQALERLLIKHNEKKRVVMTDGVFSMDGDCARLQEITELCAMYNALLVVDDAHGIGALGQQGAGLVESLALTQQQVPLLVGTFGKAFGISGAFVSG